jgi:hypothetical protein
MENTHKFEQIIECPSCRGTGLYQGMAEGEGIAVVCYKCKGSGAYHYVFEYTPFKERKIKEGIKRVYKKGTGYKMGLGMINFDRVGQIDMNKEGISYQEFLNGKMPEHITKLECPMLADQGACHDIPGFVSKCNELNGGWISYIPKCIHYSRKEECWKRFHNKK